LLIFVLYNFAKTSDSLQLHFKTRRIAVNLLTHLKEAERACCRAQNVTSSVKCGNKGGLGAKMPVCIWEYIIGRATTYSALPILFMAGHFHTRALCSRTTAMSKFKLQLN